VSGAEPAVQQNGGVLPLVLPLFAGLFLIAVVALVLARRQSSEPGVLARSVRWAERLSTRLTTFGAAAVIGLLGTTVVMLAHMLLGRLLGSLTFDNPAPISGMANVDLDVYTWTDSHLVAVQGGAVANGWHRLNELITQMGNNHQLRLVTVGLVVVLTILSKRRRWVPFVVLGGAIVVEKYVQTWVAHAANRGHPPLTLGTWPSGGTTRVLCVYGLAVFLLLRIYRPSRRVQIAAWAGVASLGLIEAYTRWYLEKHWFLDTIGGLTFGAGLLLVFCLATAALDPDPQVPAEAEPDEPALTSDAPATH
jgi:membrane-associated phospholipid phosphatase